MRRHYEDMKEIEELIESYRRDAVNYGRRFHKTRPKGAYDGSAMRVRSENLEEFSDDSFYVEDFDEFEE